MQEGSTVDSLILIGAAMRCEWAACWGSRKHHDIGRYRSLAEGSGFKINGDDERQWAMVREDAFSVVDYGALIVNIGDRVHRGTGGGLRTVSGHSAL